MQNKKRQARIGLFSAGWRRSWHLIVCVLFLLGPFDVVGEENRLYLAGAEGGELSQLVRTRIESRFGDRISVAPYNRETDSDALVLALDASAVAEVRANNNDQPVVSLFSTSNELERIIDDWGQFSAIYSEPPLDRQARLGRLIVPRSQTVAILSSSERAGSYESLIASIELMGLEARVFVVSSSDTLIRDLNRALAYGDFLLGTPDSRIFNRNTVKPLLLTSYRRNRLVIGPSRPFVRAGAVASTYTPARNQVDEGLQLVEDWFDTGELPEPRYPDHFEVIVNEQVARSMNLPLPSEDELREFLIAGEEEQ